MAVSQPRISVQYVDDAAVVAFTDEKILEETDVRALRTSIEAVIEQASRIHLVLDFRHVRFLSSAVLGLLIRISKRIYEVFKITRLTSVFEIHEDVDSAIRSFPERQQQ